LICGAIVLTPGDDEHANRPSGRRDQIRPRIVADVVPGERRETPQLVWQRRYGTRLAVTLMTVWQGSVLRAPSAAPLSPSDANGRDRFINMATFDRRSASRAADR
jgi:hypothetical protein